MIDISIDRINELIKSEVGENEDAFQNAWVSVMGDHCQTEDDIKLIAQKANRQYVHKFAELSLQKPIGNPDFEGILTLEGVIAAPPELSDEEIDAEISGKEPYQANSSGKYNRNGHVTLDWDTICALRKLYPHDPLNLAIRRLVHVPPPVRIKKGWHKWEDAIVRTRYPWGGARAVQLDVYHSLNAIEKRAALLGVKAGKALNSYKPVSDWLNIPELAEKLGCTYEVAERLINTGQICSIRIPKYHQGRDGVFVTPDAIEKYENHKEENKRLRRLQHDANLRAKKEANKRLLGEAEKLAKKLLKRKLKHMATKEVPKVISRQKIMCKRDGSISGCVLDKSQARAIIRSYLERLAESIE
jgi:hypothetical protein